MATNPRDPAWRDKQKIGDLMARVLKHANGEVEMTQSQIAAAKLYLSKTVPDLNRTELAGDPENPIKHELSEQDRDILRHFVKTKPEIFK